jgi:CheY-like chemotaxis protein
MGLIAGGLVHDFNNLMASILGYSSLLVEEIEKNNPIHQDIIQIHKTAEEASDRMARMMSYAQNVPYIVNDLNINQLVKEIAGILSRISNKNLTIRADLQPDITPFRGDASQIQQVILQLALNAKEAMDEGGKLLFKTRVIDVGERGLLKNQGATPGQYVQLTVSDTGCGITPENKVLLFKTAFSSKEENRGRGTGLMFVKKIIEAHKGFISVFSEPENGTMIKVHFPIEVQEETIQVDQSDAVLLGKETVLMVDEEQLLRDAARKMLIRYGYKVITAKTSNEAVLQLKKHSDRIDLIVLDLHMRGPLIQRVIQRFKQLKPNVKIIISTNKGENVTTVNRLKNVIAGQVEKPYQVRTFMHTIRSILDA